MIKKTFLSFALIAVFGLTSCKNKTNSEIEAPSKNVKIETGLIASFGDMPSITYGANEEIGVVFGNEESIYFSSSTDNGVSFNEPTLVTNLKGLALGYSSGPGITMTKDYIVVTAPNKEGNIYSWRKPINGQFWEGPFKINDVDKSAGENLSAITSSLNGRLFCTWIDTRFLENSNATNHSVSNKKAETHHKEKNQALDLNKMIPTGITYRELIDKIGDIPENATLAFHDDDQGNLYWVFLDKDREALKTENFEEFKKFRQRNGGRVKAKGKIYFATSDDGGKSWSKSRLIYQSPDGGVCECCKPSITCDTDGSVYIMFRNNINGSRDLHVTKSMDNGETFSNPEKMGVGTWEIKGCPMDGGDITINEKSVLNTVWQREGGIFVSNSDDSELKIGYGRSPSITSSNKTTNIVFTDGEDIMTTDLQQPYPKKIGTGSFPKVLIVENAIIYLWVNNEGIQYKRFNNNS